MNLFASARLLGHDAPDWTTTPLLLVPVSRAHLEAVEAARARLSSTVESLATAEVCLHLPGASVLWPTSLDDETEAHIGPALTTQFGDADRAVEPLVEVDPVSLPSWVRCEAVEHAVLDVTEEDVRIRVWGRTPATNEPVERTKPMRAGPITATHLATQALALAVTDAERTDRLDALLASDPEAGLEVLEHGLPIIGPAPGRRPVPHPDLRAAVATLIEHKPELRRRAFALLGDLRDGPRPPVR